MEHLHLLVSKIVWRDSSYDKSVLSLVSHTYQTYASAEERYWMAVLLGQLRVEEDSPLCSYSLTLGPYLLRLSPRALEWKERARAILQLLSDSCHQTLATSSYDQSNAIPSPLPYVKLLGLFPTNFFLSHHCMVVSTISGLDYARSYFGPHLCCHQ